MAQRGRKSAASLAVISPIPGARRPPPPDLSPEEAMIWRRVVASRPADWFDDGSASILAQHCRHSAAADLLSVRLARFLPEDLEDREARSLYKGLLTLRAQETREIVNTARQLRLTQQSLYRPETAATKAREAGPGGRRPGEFDGAS